MNDEEMENINMVVSDTDISDKNVTPTRTSHIFRSRQTTNHESVSVSGGSGTQKKKKKKKRTIMMNNDDDDKNDSEKKKVGGSKKHRIKKMKVKHTSSGNKNGNGNDTNDVEEKTSSEVLDVMNQVIRVDANIGNFEAKYPYLNDALLKNDIKGSFLTKLSSIGSDELDNMETEFKNIAMIEINSVRMGSSVILKLHNKWLRDSGSDSDSD